MKTDKERRIAQIEALRESAKEMFQSAHVLQLEAHSHEQDAEKLAVDVILNDGLLQKHEWKFSLYDVDAASRSAPIVLLGGRYDKWADVFDLLQPEWDSYVKELCKGVILRMYDGEVSLRFDNIEVLSNFDNEYNLPMALEELYDLIDAGETLAKHAKAMLKMLLARKEGKIIRELGYD